jgi:hypothetical protein
MTLQHPLRQRLAAEPAYVSAPRKQVEQACAKGAVEIGRSRSMVHLAFRRFARKQPEGPSHVGYVGSCVRKLSASRFAAQF